MTDLPGLLLMCHGEFPDGFFSAGESAGRYRTCMTAMELLCDGAHGYYSSGNDVFTRMGLQVAGYLSAGIKLGHLGLSYLGPRASDIRQAIYCAASNGAHRIVCVGASGLIVPGLGVSGHLPLALKKVLLDNPALDLLLAPPGIDTGSAARLIWRSLKHALSPGAGDGAPQLCPCGDLEDTGLVLICAHDYAVTGPGPCATAVEFVNAADALSGMSRESYRDGGRSDAVDLMRGVAASLREIGLPAVEAGFMDFALPDLEEASRDLLDSGATRIIAVGMPSLLHRHPLALIDPVSAIERLRSALPHTPIVYVKPDPVPIAASIAGLLWEKVLEALASGESLKINLRDQ